MDDPQQAAINEANAAGLGGVVGDATRAVWQLPAAESWRYCALQR
ncbi:hypothetical protein ABN034_28185 [Actinopolymorpha sp. B11F2]